MLTSTNESDGTCSCSNTNGETIKCSQHLPTHNINDAIIMGYYAQNRNQPCDNTSVLINNYSYYTSAQFMLMPHII